MSSIKVAAIQMRCVKSPEENLKNAESKVRKAASEGADIILLPELFEREYFCQQRQYGFYHYAKPVLENEAVQMGMRLAKELGVVLPISFYEREINHLYNSVACIDADGSLLGVYRKTHIPDDHYYQEKLFYAGRYRVSGISDEIRYDRRRYLLGSVVPGDGAVHGVKGGGTFALSDGNRFRADFGVRQYAALEALHAGTCRGESDAGDRREPDRNGDRRTV